MPAGMNHIINQGSEGRIKHDPDSITSWGGVPPLSEPATSPGAVGKESRLKTPTSHEGAARRRRSSVVNEAHNRSLRMKTSMALHEDPAFDIDFFQSDECENREFMLLLNKVRSDPMLQALVSATYFEPITRAISQP